MAIYGVRFDGINSAGVRTDDAVGMVWERSTHEVAGRDDFAAVSPFNVRECVTKYNSSTQQREVLGYKGDAGYDTLRADTTNDIMIEFPLFWYQRPSKYVWRVSDSPVYGFKISPMHYHKGRIYKYVRVSKYAINSNYISQTNSSPLVNTNMNTFRTNVRAKGQYIMDYPTRCSLTMLSLVKYANMDIQNTVGYGYSGSEPCESGLADGVLGLDGSSGLVTDSNSVLTHGIENFYGNTWKFIDGIYGYGGYLYYKDVFDMLNDPVDESELVSNYIKINTAIIFDTSTSSISDIAFDSDYDFGIFPINIGSPSPSGDACWTNAYFACIYVGGAAWDGNARGLFTFASNHGPGHTAHGNAILAMELSDPILQKQLYITSNNKVYAMMESI